MAPAPANRPKTLAELRAAGWTPENCPVRDVISQVAGKWSMLLLIALAERPMRFGELRRAVADVSQRMLTMTLRDQQREGLITRRVYPTVPPAVEYALTDLGRSLVQASLPMVQWAETHHDAVRNARARFDAAQASPPGDLP